MIQALIKLPRKTKKGLMFLFDVAVIISCLFAAFSIRMIGTSKINSILDYLYYPAGDNNLMLIMFASPLLALPIFSRFGLYHTVIRYAGFKSLWRINQATTLYAILWGFIAFMVANWEAFPRSVILINWILVIFTIGGSRLFARWLLSEVNVNNNKRNMGRFNVNQVETVVKLTLMNVL